MTLWAHSPETVAWKGTFPARGCRYSRPTRSFPALRSTTSKDETPARARTVGTAESRTHTCSVRFPRTTRTFAYVNAGWAAIARFAGRVHGVVVQMRRDSSGRPFTGNVT